MTKRKVTDLLPTEAILISSDEDLKVLDEFEKAGVLWSGNRKKPTEWNPKNIGGEYPYVLINGKVGLFWDENEQYNYPATDFIPTEADGCDKWCGENYCDTNGCTNRKRNLVNEPIPTEAEKVEVDEGSTIESVFKLTKWILENRVSSLIDADIPQEDKDRIARHFGYSADLTNP